MHNKLPTKARLLQWGLSVDSLSVFCKSSMKDRDHLFFQYSFTYRIWNQVMGCCLVSQFSASWQEINSPMGAVLLTLKVRGLDPFCANLLGGLLSITFGDRNAILHSGNIYTEEQLISLIKKDVI